MSVRCILKIAIIAFVTAGMTYCNSPDNKKKDSQKSFPIRNDTGVKAKFDYTKPLVIGSFLKYPLSNPSKQNGIFDLIYKEAFSRIGIKILIERLPAQRSIINANKGIIDGDISRIHGLGRLFPSLIEIPESTFEFDFVAITKSKDIEIKNWDGLKPYTIALVRGWKILEEKTVHVTHVKGVKNGTLLFTLLKKDRVDIILYDRIGALALIKDLNINSARILEPPLIIKKMHLFLHKKHKNIIFKVDKALKDMKKDGTFKKIMDKAFKGYTNFKLNY